MVFSPICFQLYLDIPIFVISSRDKHSLFLKRFIVESNFWNKSVTSGLARVIKISGRTSGTPPTSVDTTNKPIRTASTIAIQNASVRAVFRKTSASFKTDGTSYWVPREQQYCETISG